MPPPLALLGPGAVVTAKHVAFRAATFVDVYTATSASLAAILARVLWKRIPNWIKQDISFQNLIKGSTRRQRRSDRDGNDDFKDGADGDGDNINEREELSHLGSVIDKLAAYADAAKVVSPVPQLHAAVLAYIQLSGQLKLKQQDLKEYESDLKNLEGEDTVNNGNPDEFVQEDEAEHHLFHRDSLYKSAGMTVSPQEVLYNNVELQESLHFAAWAYYEDTAKLEAKLEEIDFVLLEHTMEVSMMSVSPSSERLPGTVDYYVALSTKRKQLVVGVKGTSTLEELLTDCCGKAVPLHSGLNNHYSRSSSCLSDSCRSNSSPHDTMGAAASRVEVIAKQPNMIEATSDGSDIVEIVSGHERISVEDHDENGDNYARCHEGILISTRKMLNKIQPLIERYLVDMNDSNNAESGGYRLLLCGHSLGAGAAALAAALLRMQLPKLFPSLTTSEEQQRRPSKNAVHVYAFAPPPVLDHDSAIAASSYCTTIINNADIIPRCSLVNLLVFMEFLRSIHERLEENGMNPTGPVTTTAFLKKLSQGTSSIENADLLLTMEEAHTAMKNAYDTVELRHPDHLYVPGRVLLAYRPWCEGNRKSGTVETNEMDTVQQTSKDNDASLPDSPTPPNDFEELTMPTPEFECTVVDGAAPVLRIFEIDGMRMFTDHVTSSYYDLLGSEYNF